LTVAGPTETESEWLSLVRYQLAVAREQCSAPPPLNALGINQLQDGVESLLAASAEHLHVPLKNRPEFLAVFDAVAVTLGPTSALPGHRAAMAALNTARVNFKHHGNAPANTTLMRHLDRALDFAEVLTVEAFGISLDAVSLLLFVRCVEARQHLEQAKAMWPQNRTEATQELRLAYDTLVRDFESRKAWSPGNTLFSTKPSFLPSVFDLRDAGKVAEKHGEWLENLDRWVRTLALGIDVRQYAYFDAHMPSMMRAIGGNVFFTHRDGLDVTEEVFARCLKFVVDTALSLGADDFDFDYWAVRQAVREAQASAIAQP
jgi:hypothetical protein